MISIRHEGILCNGYIGSTFFSQSLIKGAIELGLFKPPLDTGRLLSKGIRWLTWKQLRKILEITKGQFRTQAERKLVEDLIIY